MSKRQHDATVKKDGFFYSEIVLVTVLSLIAANSWIRVLNTVMKKYCTSIKAEIIVAMVLSVLAIVILWSAFKTRETDEYRPVHMPPSTDEYVGIEQCGN